MDVELGPDGRFGWRDLSLYWIDPDLHPFLARANNRLAGLAMVKRGSYISGDKAVWDMAEFFVVRSCRRRGIGSQVAHEVWRQFPGWWEIRVMESNPLGCGFWQHAITQYTGETAYSVHVEKGGRSWSLFSFESKGGE
jgi:predicted acetyltransferase